MELIIFVSFLVVQLTAKMLPTWASKISHLAVVQRLSQHHWIVWVIHPAVLHSVHEYAIHFIVYSGYVIKAH